MYLIKSDDQRRKAVKKIQEFEAQIQRIRESRGFEKAEVFAQAHKRHLADLKEQIQIYDELREKGLEPLRPRHLAEVGAYLVKARISSDMTQTDLAKKLRVSQPMVHKYENSEYQGAGLELLSKAAKALGVSLHLETFLPERKRVYHPQKQEAAILYFSQQINNTFLGRTKLMKLLYYADYEWIQKKGVSLTGDTYVAMPYGPVPKHAQQALKQLEKKGAIRIEKTKLGNYDLERCIGLEEPDLSVLTSEEITHLGSIARRFEFWTAKQMSDLTHEDWPWLSTRLGEEIGL
jgi:uncharacterized phage-associated protein/ribosome-binding protein aMBF1 (putative translation factor)